MGLSGEQCPDTGGYSLEVRKEGQGLRGWASGRCFLCFSSSEHTVLQGDRDRRVLDRIPASETWDTRGVLTVQRASASAGCPPASGQGRGHLGAWGHFRTDLLRKQSCCLHAHRAPPPCWRPVPQRAALAPASSAFGPVGRVILCHGLCIVGHLQHLQPLPTGCRSMSPRCLQTLPDVPLRGGVISPL